jgi:hypothetical protein
MPAPGMEPGIRSLLRSPGATSRRRFGIRC